MRLSTEPLNRLHSLDALRGIAALSVVFWHWQHFFAVKGVFEDGWKRETQPLYWMFRPLYDQGWAAVDLFFPLSGFIFYWLYSETIAHRKLGFGGFAVLRFSRLYPLHTLMLLVAAVLQLLIRARTGHWFIYTANTLPHFFSSLVMAQQWLPPTLDQFFDGPAWSVSIEVLLYGVFFAVVRAGLGGWRVAALIAVASIPLVLWNEFIARGLMGFFVGGVAFHLFEAIRKSPHARPIAQGLGLATIAIWVLIVYETYLEPMHAVVAYLAGPLAGIEDYSDYVGWLFRLLFTFVATPVTILALALDEQFLRGRYQRLSRLGDISYSTYLLHFPLQMLLVLTALQFGWTWHPFMRLSFMLGFFAVLIGLGTLSFRYFEQPTQNWIRRSVGVVPGVRSEVRAKA
jgi:peptidoglycan/LPS O-acetylase OafA/YrhL